MSYSNNDISHFYITLFFGCIEHDCESKRKVKYKIEEKANVVKTWTNLQIFNDVMKKIPMLYKFTDTETCNHWEQGQDLVWRLFPGNCSSTSSKFQPQTIINYKSKIIFESCKCLNIEPYICGCKQNAEYELIHTIKEMNEGYYTGEFLKFLINDFKKHQSLLTLRLKKLYNMLAELDENQLFNTILFFSPVNPDTQRDYYDDNIDSDTYNYSLCESGCHCYDCYCTTVNESF